MKNIVREKFIEFSILDIHVPYLAILIVFLLICSYKITFNTQDKINKIIRVTLIAFLVLSLIQLSGVMSILLLGVFILAEFLFSRISIQSKLFVIILISVSFVFLIPVLEKAEPTNRVRGAENIIYRTQQLMKSNDPVRRENWESVIKVIKSNILLGIGADGGMELLQIERDIDGEPYINEHNAHNDLLEILLRYGLIGLSIFLLIVISLAKKAYLTRNYYFIWFLIVFMISGMTESYLQRQIGLVFFVFVSLLFYTYKENNLLEINTI
ncbi:MAG: O-antigen ligase family protein [Aureibaculum sp.]